MSLLSAGIRRDLLIAAVGVGVSSVLVGCDRGSVSGSGADSTAASAARGTSRETPATSPSPYVAATELTGPTASESQAAQLAPPPAATLTKGIAVSEQAAITSLPPGAGHDLVVGNCLICHAASMIEQQHKDEAAWSKTVSQMMQWGAPLPPAQKPTLIAYLALHFPARAPAPVAQAVP